MGEKEEKAPVGDGPLPWGESQSLKSSPPVTLFPCSSSSTRYEVQMQMSEVREIKGLTITEVEVRVFEEHGQEGEQARV